MSFEKIFSLPKKEKEIFDRIFNLDISYHKHLKTNENNPIFKLKNKITKEEIFFNIKRIQHVLKNKKSKCSFCFWEKETIPTNLNLKNKFWIMIDNLFPYDILHSLLIFRKHDIKKFNLEILKEIFEKSFIWFNNYFEQNKKFIYPIIGINFKSGAGASIEHPHFHLLLSKEPYYFEKKLIRIENYYKEKFKKEYFDDYFKIAQKLDLGIKIKNIIIFATLTSLKGFQIYILSKNLSEHLIEIFSKIFNLFIKENLSFNFVILPSFKNNKFRKNNFSAFIIRNKIGKKTSDFGFMEIYGTPIANFNPWQMFEKIKKELT